MLKRDPQKWNAMRKRAFEKMKAKKAEKRQTTDPYFSFHERNARGVCENCGRKIPHWQRRMSAAHILPKRDNQFPSVAGELDNHMELCVEGGCHDLYDRSWEDAAAMKVFVLAKERFKLFQDKISPTERNKIPHVFLAP